MVEGLTPEEVMLEKGKSGGRVNSDPVSKGEEHMAEVTTAMLYLACGGMDEAHNLVLPYSWPEDTKFGGQAIKGSPAAKESEYCHALVHRYRFQFDTVKCNTMVLCLAFVVTPM